MHAVDIRSSVSGQVGTDTSVSGWRVLPLGDGCQALPPKPAIRCVTSPALQRDKGDGPGAGQESRRRGVRSLRTAAGCYGTAKNCAFPGRLSEPGPARSASPSSARLPVCGMQKLLTSTPAWGAPSVRSPAGDPFCVIACVVPCPNAPACGCAGQKSPSAAVVVTGDEVSGLRLMGSVATKVPGSGRQSTDVCVLLPVVQGR